jgi:hypothetical protein
MAPHPLEYARTPETRRTPRRRATGLDRVYMWLVVMCYLIPLADHGIGSPISVRRTHYHYIDQSCAYAEWACWTYLFGVAAILSATLSLIGLRGIVRDGVTRCPSIMLNGTFLSSLLALILLCNGCGGRWFALVYESFHLW